MGYSFKVSMGCKKLKMKSTLIFLTSCLVWCLSASASPRIEPLVETKVGLIRGLSADDGDYEMFLGIPFGKVSEDNPFGPSTPYPKFKETFEANDDSAICPQIEEFNNTIVGSLDCLHLNVYVPRSASSRNRLPVLVWIYGGGFRIGFAGRYVHGPKFFMRNDIILVTINYRLGPYGFMCLGTPEVPGNQGLKDQLLGLRWVNDNIKSFGGDVDKITIMGESAGGASVDFHLHSAKETLFRSVIMQSGTSLLPGFFSTAKPELALALSKQLGLVTDNVNQALTFLSSVEPHLVIAAATSVGYFQPCLENQFEGIESLTLDYPVNTELPKAKNMPVLIGVNSEESWCSYAQNSFDFETAGDLFETSLLTSFDFDSITLSKMETIVRHFYIGDAEISNKEKNAIANFQSDSTFNYPTQRIVAKLLDNEAGNIYQYVFSYTGGRNFVKQRLNITTGGACHADEVGYLFDVSFWKDAPTHEDQIIVDRMTTMWANFVKFSDPTPETSELLPLKWEPITKNTAYNYMDINLELKMQQRPFHSRMAFWDLFYMANEKYEIGINN